MTSPIIPQIRCRLCKCLLSLTNENFYQYKNAKGEMVFFKTCKQCKRNQVKQRALDNPDKVKNGQKRTYQKYKNDRNKRNSEWNKSHPESRKETTKRYRGNHPDKCHKSNKEWLDKHPEKKREYTGRRRQRVTNADGFYTSDDIVRLFNEQQGKCKWCECELTSRYEIDHIQPVSKGGSNWPQNLALTCRKCNRSKSGKTLEEWLKTRDLH